MVLHCMLFFQTDLKKVASSYYYSLEDLFIIINFFSVAFCSKLLQLELEFNDNVDLSLFSF